MKTNISWHKTSSCFKAKKKGLTAAKINQIAVQGRQGRESTKYLLIYFVIIKIAKNKGSQKKKHRCGQKTQQTVGSDKCVKKLMTVWTGMGWMGHTGLVNRWVIGESK